MLNLFSIPEKKLLIKTPCLQAEIYARLADRFMKKNYEREVFSMEQLRSEHFYAHRDFVTITRRYEGGRNKNHRYEVLAEGTVQGSGAEERIIAFRLYLRYHQGLVLLPLYMIACIGVLGWFVYRSISERALEGGILLLLIPILLIALYTRWNALTKLNTLAEEIRSLFS